MPSLAAASCDPYESASLKRHRKLTYPTPHPRLGCPSRSIRNQWTKISPRLLSDSLPVRYPTFPPPGQSENKKFLCLLSLAVANLHRCEFDVSYRILLRLASPNICNVRVRYTTPSFVYHSSPPGSIPYLPSTFHVTPTPTIATTPHITSIHPGHSVLQQYTTRH